MAKRRRGMLSCACHSYVIVYATPGSTASRGGCMHLRQSLLLFTFVGLLFSNCFSQETKPPYHNPNLPAEQRAADLVKRMTLEEKVDQIAGGRRRARTSENPEEKEAFEALGKLYREDSQASPHDAAEARNKAQHFLVE